MASDSYYIRLAVRIFFDFGVSIAIPAVVATLVGVRLDSKWGTEPWMLVLLLIIAFLSTGVWIYKKAKYYKKLYENPV
ncbi:MAG: AtpZ/AtpI family protein [Patescibacteria group bacterium]